MFLNTASSLSVLVFFLASRTALTKENTEKVSLISINKFLTVCKRSSAMSVTVEYFSGIGLENQLDNFSLSSDNNSLKFYLAENVPCDTFTLPPLVEP